MQLHVPHAERRLGVLNATRGDFVERRLQSYRPELQRAVRTLARRHSRLADLATSFPALLVALAVPRAGFNSEPVIARVIQGVPLAELARAADLPLWLRGFAPQAFLRAIPKLPDNSDFRCKIANHLPSSPKLAPAWIDTIADAAACGHEEIAIWFARNMAQYRKQVRVARIRARRRKNVCLDRLRLICLWAWFSNRPDTRAHRLMEQCWSPTMQFRAAIEAASAWWTAVELYAELGEESIADMWVRPGSVEGYDFVPLRSFAEIAEESRTMRNCIQSYGHDLVHNYSRLWSIQKDGRRVATLGIGFDSGDPLPNVFELRSAGNRDVTVEVSRAARRWLHLHDLSRITAKRLEWDTVPLNRSAWIALWKPYWLAKRRIPDWLPLQPSRRALRAL